ncbi:AAA family ATPase [Sediminibacillus dalangtanensis]|uniref:AAA family ATPase n=1 Tax=Sediminibacillus dalangtanensis TaxID=2729421 RepID=A0ABX7VZ58_9BACI|nr:RNA polymerase recycling motor HelD [Sediminibacillus dalangtanensis]QTN01026.1 AAA family ATPase [Sediminibacillus dalangtanensis]
MDEKDWKQERERLNEVLNIIDTTAEKLQGRKSGIKDRVLDLRKNFWEDVTVNLDEPDDVIETQASLKQQAELLSERERSHGQLSEQLKTLARLKESPYFGRIDFREDGEQEADKIYLGIASLMDEQEDEFLVYDWRAPISSLYYDYPPGRAAYQTTEETINGEIKLKRQYIIRNSQLKGMFDTGLTIGDHLLQSVLGNNASTQMKSIVATIQKEQNQIIRNEKNDLLIVQGVAGSGKTSAALQRVAYLLYRYREVLSSDNMVLFSPNPLFNSYVSTVLPELGEENMQQTTFHEYLEQRLGGRFDIETPFAQMEYYLAASQEPDYNTRLSAMTFKAGMQYKQLMDQFIEGLHTGGIEFRNVTFRGTVIVDKKLIAEYFYGLDPAMNLPNRMEATAKWLLKQVDKYAKGQLQEDWVLEEGQLLEKEDFLSVYQQLQEEDASSDDPYYDFVREEELLRQKVIDDNFQPLRQKIKRRRFFHAEKTFHKLFDAELVVDGVKLPENWPAICRQSLELLEQRKLTWEEAAPYLYFYNRLVGFQVNRSIRHLFIDEAQDYSPFQFAYFQEVFPLSRMTLLGDYNQAIYAHASTEETLLSSELEAKHERITLTRSYRSTRQIVEFTKAFMPGGDVIEPFNREGSKPLLTQVPDKQKLKQQLLQTIKGYTAANHQTIAVICKTMEESREAYQLLREETEAKLMDEETHTFQKGLLVIPAYLAKGIEFDAAIIYNASAAQYYRELERNLLYTACTRAMHELAVFSIGPVSAFLQQLPEDLYDRA